MKVKDAEKYKDCLPILLIDSEITVDSKHENGNTENWKPWEHLKDREQGKWICPQGVADNQCHLMVQCMETWLLCDIDNLKSFYGQGFSDNNLLKDDSIDIEKIDKEKIYQCIKDATRNCHKKGCYDKGSHSFKLLGTTDYQRVIEKSK